jgi:hypothetical protein
MNAILITAFAKRTTFISQNGARLLKCLAVAGSMLLAGTAAPASAKTVELWHRPGGYTHQHILQANRWLASGTKLVIRDWQVSAAAIQVVYFKRKGGNVCFAKSGFNGQPSLHFHLSESRGTHRNTLAQYIGKANTAKVGKLSAYNFKSFHPSAFGIKACSGTIKADSRTRSRPSLMRW